MIASAIAFMAIAAMLCVAAVLALLGTGQLALSGSDALGRDGLPRGQAAPAWSMRDAAGTGYTSPPARPLQLVIFADHSLRSFPSVVDGLRSLRDQRDDDLEIVILTRGDAAHSRPLLSQLGLDGIPVLSATPASYGRYNVRVMPFAIFVDSAGLVRASSLVNHDWQLAKLRQIAALPLEQGDLAAV